jgi:hypothetical protein
MSLHQGGAALQQQALRASSVLQNNSNMVGMGSMQQQISSSMGGMGNMQQMGNSMGGMNSNPLLQSVPSFGGYGVSSSSGYPGSSSMHRGSDVTQQGAGGAANRNSRGSEWGNAVSYVDKKLCQVRLHMDGGEEVI